LRTTLETFGKFVRISQFISKALESLSGPLYGGEAESVYACLRALLGFALLPRLSYLALTRPPQL
jgi:hypothetical protein